jgi:hypothetical protein
LLLASWNGVGGSVGFVAAGGAGAGGDWLGAITVLDGAPMFDGAPITPGDVGDPGVRGAAATRTGASPLTSVVSAAAIDMITPYAATATRAARRVSTR